MKGTTAPGGKGKQAEQVFLWPVARLARPPVKVSANLVEALILESCPDGELLAKRFCSNWSRRYV